MLLDFKRAFLYGEVERELFIRLPPEDERAEGGEYVGVLKKAMYGTRDAPAVWQRLVRKVMLQLGFHASRTAACVYVHRTRGLQVVAHADDFLVTGPKVESMALKAQLQRDYEVDGDILWTDADEKKEGRFLGRTIRVQQWGLEVEGDGRLIDGLLEEFGGNGKSAETPGVKNTEDSGVEGHPRDLMVPSEAARFRRGAAKLNYIAQDRGDLAYASKEISKRMARPEVGDLKLVEGAVEYLRRYPRWVSSYAWQHPPGGLTVYTDSDWGGCTRTRRSTSGGVVLHGSHCLLTWSRTQHLVSLSSAEAELNASIKAAQEGLSLKNLAYELGDEIWLKLRGDSSANDGILKRTGTGKIKHLSVRQLWVQERVGMGELHHEKVPRAINCSDVVTHHYTKVEAEGHFARMACHRPGSQKHVGATGSAGPKGGFGEIADVFTRVSVI